jgi:hypothetical protein
VLDLREHAVVLHARGGATRTWPLPQDIAITHDSAFTVGAHDDVALATWTVGVCGSQETKEYMCGGRVWVSRWRLGESVPPATVVADYPGDTDSPGRVQMAFAGDGRLTLAWDVVDLIGSPVGHRVAVAEPAQQVRLLPDEGVKARVLGVDTQANATVVTTLRGPRLYEQRIAGSGRTTEHLVARLTGAHSDFGLTFARNRRGDRIVTYAGTGDHTLVRMSPAGRPFGRVIDFPRDASVTLGEDGAVTAVEEPYGVRAHQTVRVRRGSVSRGLGRPELIAGLDTPETAVVMGAGVTVLVITAVDHHGRAVTSAARARRGHRFGPLQPVSHGDCMPDAIRPAFIHVACVRENGTHYLVRRWRP